MDCCPQHAPMEVTLNVDEALSADPQNAPAPRDDPRHGCASCGRASRPVTRKTMLLMLKPELFDRLGGGEYRFCPDPECRVVYFTESANQTFTTEHLRVRVGLKERTDPIPLCYCFGFDEADVRGEVERMGRTSIPQRIAELLKRKMCACPARNPSGACCLGEVTKAVKRLLANAAQ
ncbi:MAG: (2Fe-2S)-binding protein [Acidobacteria bacterium]|nr:(2Fe-2S)-binding protein [Acidobacteriota bacterium]